MTVALSAHRSAPATTGSTPPPRQRRSLRPYLPQYLAISPFYLLFAVFGLFPIGFSIYLSFHDWDGIGDMTFVGISQYAYLVTDPIFWRSVFNTFAIFLISTIPMLFFALVIAFLLHSNLKFKSAYRAAFFIPNVTSMVAMALVFGSVFSDSFGLVNSALTALQSVPIPWLSSEWGIKVTIAAMVVWRWTGYNAIIYLAGLQAVSTDVYEAARIDGANTWQIFTRVTIPLLRPVIVFTIITSTIGGLGLFTEPQVLLGTNGGPGQSGLTIVLYQYQQAFEKLDYGYGSALGWALFVIAGLVALFNWWITKEREPRRATWAEGQA